MICLSLYFSVIGRLFSTILRAWIHLDPGWNMRPPVCHFERAPTGWILMMLLISWVFRIWVEELHDGLPWNWVMLHVFSTFSVQDLYFKLKLTTVNMQTKPKQWTLDITAISLKHCCIDVSSTYPVSYLRGGLKQNITTALSHTQLSRYFVFFGVCGGVLLSAVSGFGHEPADLRICPHSDFVSLVCVFFFFFFLQEYTDSARKHQEQWKESVSSETYVKVFLPLQSTLITVVTGVLFISKYSFFLKHHFLSSTVT